jgi:hypothetical protein
MKEVPRDKEGKVIWRTMLTDLDYWIGENKKERIKFLLITLWMIALILMAWGYRDLSTAITDINNNPCDYVPKINQMCSDSMSTQPFKINLEVDYGKDS